MDVWAGVKAIAELHVWSEQSDGFSSACNIQETMNIIDSN